MADSGGQTQAVPAHRPSRMHPVRRLRRHLPPLRPVRRPLPHWRDHPRQGLRSLERRRPKRPHQPTRLRLRHPLLIVAESVDVRRANERMHTKIDWLDSWHSFSFGEQYDPRNTHHGLLLVSNDDVIAPGGGFGTHPHRDMEIVTWALDGALEHRDSEGNHGLIVPGPAEP